MKLQILVPQYKETDEVIKPLLDSIAIQKGVNFDDIGVIIVNDGSEVGLTKSFLDSYPFKIEYITNIHKGVSAARNHCLALATADYVMFCDADDCFYHVYALQIILETINVYGFDVLVNAFYEEVVTPDGQHSLLKHDNDTIFVHGKVYNREFLVINDIYWDTNLLIHEDSYFNCLAGALAQKKRYCPEPYYLWCWNPKSISRQDPKYVIKTYSHLIKSADALSTALLNRGYDLDSAKMFAINLFQTFYIMTGIYSEDPNLVEVIDKLKPLAKQFYNKFEHLLQYINPNELQQIRSNTRQAAIEHQWYKETITFPDWIKSL